MLDVPKESFRTPRVEHAEARDESYMALTFGTLLSSQGADAHRSKPLGLFRGNLRNATRSVTSRSNRPRPCPEVGSLANRTIGFFPLGGLAQSLLRAPGALPAWGNVRRAPLHSECWCRFLHRGSSLRTRRTLAACFANFQIGGCPGAGAAVPTERIPLCHWIIRNPRISLPGACRR